MYRVKVLVEKVSYSYESIHAYKNGCILFQRDTYKDMTKYPVCNMNQYKTYRKSQVPVSVLRHFFLISQLVRWYNLLKIAWLLMWAHLNKTTYDKIHGIHDSPAWRAINTNFPSFRRGFQNICMMLSANGFDPLSSFLCQWSTWLVFVFI